MPEEKTKVTKPKLVEVKVLSAAGDISFVSYYDKNLGTLRVNVPTNVIEDGKIPLDELDMGIPSPTDIDWEKITLKPITGSALAKAMHDEAIFTKQDIVEKRQVVIIAINRLTGLLLKDIFEQL